MAPVRNLHSTTIPAQMARPVELWMKSMRNTTGLACGAGVDVLCRFPVTLSAQSRGLGRRGRSTPGSDDPQATSPTVILERISLDWMSTPNAERATR